MNPQTLTLENLPISYNRKREYMKEYSQRPEVILRRKEYFKKYNKKHYQENKEEIHIKSSRYYQKHRDEISKQKMERQQKIKKEIILHYASEIKCQRCGFSDMRALSIDHINGGGVKHKKKLKLLGFDFYRWLIKNNYPEGYQVLCMNCQWIKRA